MKNLKAVLFFALAWVILLSSCSEGSGDNPEPIMPDDRTVGVAFHPRKFAPGLETDSQADILNEEFDENSILYFSQMGTIVDPNFTDESEDASPYLYEYRYYPDSEASWEEGYNFKNILPRKAFDWEIVPELGSVGNAFSFYAMYFPVDNRIRQGVETDQTNIDNFKKSDIMGAYHASSALFTRLRFNLFHLMVYLKVTIYVPVYEDAVSGDNFQTSGFDADAVRAAYLMNAYTDYSVGWRVNRSSDTEAPYTTANTSNSAPRSNIKMYLHEVNDQVIEDFPVKEYYTETNLTTDNVREYTFSVIFPAQSFGDNFLCFGLENPVNKELRYFYFSGNQIKITDTGSDVNNAYSLTQGTLQKLYLYLPRNTNDAILVGANILPWKDSLTDMTVSKDKKD